MYCTNCGNPNDDSSKFCPYCGNACQKPSHSNSHSKKNKLIEAVNKLSKKQKTTLLTTVASILLLLIIIVFLFSCGTGARSPEALIEDYVNAFNSNKAKNIINCYLNECKKIYQSNNMNVSDVDFLEKYDELYDDFSGRIITSFNIEEIEKFKANHENYVNMRELGIDIKGGARAIVNLNFSRGDADAYIFMVETSNGWYIYKVNDWY